MKLYVKIMALMMVVPAWGAQQQEEWDPLVPDSFHNLPMRNILHTATHNAPPTIDFAGKTYARNPDCSAGTEVSHYIYRYPATNPPKIPSDGKTWSIQNLTESLWFNPGNKHRATDYVLTRQHRIYGWFRDTVWSESIGGTYYDAQNGTQVDGANPCKQTYDATTILNTRGKLAIATAFVGVAAYAWKHKDKLANLLKSAQAVRVLA